MIDDRTFNEKYFKAVDIFQDWMRDYLDLSKSTILDFGCEYGIMTLSIASRIKPIKVVGVDINSLNEQLPEIIAKRSSNKIPENIEFYQVKPVEKLSSRFRFDAIFTWSTLEHVNQPNIHEVVRELYDCLMPNGFLFLQVAPLYYSAFGSHLETLVDEAWVHLSMQHDLLRQAVMKAPKEISIYKDEDDENYDAIKAGIWSCYETLNKITADELIEIFEKTGFKPIKQLRTECSPEPSESLTRIYSREILKTEQLVALFNKEG